MSDRIDYENDEMSSNVPVFETIQRIYDTKHPFYADAKCYQVTHELLHLGKTTGP